METQVETEKKIDLGEAFNQLFQQTSGTGEEELLRIASTYSRQITGEQMRALLFLRYLSNYLPGEMADRITDLLNYWIELKQWNNSALFVMKALEYISLKKFLGENAIKVNVEK